MLRYRERFVRFHDRPVDSELPAVEEASDPVAFASTDHERSLSVTAPFVEDADHALAVSKGDKMVAHDIERKGIAIGFRQIG